MSAIYPLQLCTQKALAIAVNTVMMKLILAFKVSFFIRKKRFLSE